MLNSISSLLSLATLLLAVQQTAAAATKLPPCGERVVALATGITINIGGQHGELNATQQLIAIESKTPVDHEAFLLGKGALLADIAGGMNIRKFNQAIAPKNNPALPGLAKYAKAQEAEQKLAESLTGDPAHDKKILDTLVGDIHNGTMLNEQNRKNAISKCTLAIEAEEDKLD